MKLYWGSGSPVSWRVQIALALKRVPHDSHRLDLGAREHRSDSYRSINPKGTFPILVDGDLVIRESLAILAYLERRFPEPALFGDADAAYAQAWQALLEHDAGFAADVDVITRALFRDNGLQAEGAVEKAANAVERSLTAVAEINAALSNDDWLMGVRPSVLEAAHYPTWHRLLRAAGKAQAAEIGLGSEDLHTAFPAVFAWAGRLAALPGVDATYPPHWR